MWPHFSHAGCMALEVFKTHFLNLLTRSYNNNTVFCPSWNCLNNSRQQISVFSFFITVLFSVVGSEQDLHQTGFCNIWVRIWRRMVDWWIIISQTWSNYTCKAAFLTDNCFINNTWGQDQTFWLNVSLLVGPPLWSGLKNFNSDQLLMFLSG